MAGNGRLALSYNESTTNNRKAKTMSKHADISVTVYRVTRGNVSSMGNPSYVFHTDYGKYKTQTNSGAAYELENDFPVNETIDREVTLIITPAGRVVDWKGRKRP